LAFVARFDGAFVARFDGAFVARFAVLLAPGPTRFDRAVLGLSLGLVRAVRAGFAVDWRALEGFARALGDRRAAVGVEVGMLPHALK
jgi:hypothetical protein